MNISLKLILIFLLMTVTFLNASQKETDYIAKISAPSLYSIDKILLQKTINTYTQSHPKLKAIKIIEPLSGETFYQMFKKDGETFLDEKFPENINQYDKFITISKFEEEVVGEITAYFENENLTFLTAKEKNWIEKNVIKVGVETWEPVVFSNNGKDIDGITGDVLKLISKRTGLKYEIYNGIWDSLLQKFKRKELDLLPATFYTDERTSYGLYSKEYFKIEDYIYVKEDNVTIQSLKDIRGKTLAIPKGFGTIPKIKKNFPEIIIVETRDLDDSIQRVLRGEVEALYDTQVTLEYKMKEKRVFGLKGIAQKTFNPTSVYMFSHIDKPILQSILNKALKTIDTIEINNIKSKWIIKNTHDRLEQNVIVKRDHTVTIWFILGAIGVFLFLLFILIVITKQIPDHFIAKSFGSVKFRIIALVILSIVILVFAILVSITLSENKKNVLNSVKNDLEFVLKTTQERLDTWIDERKSFLAQIGRDQELIEVTKDLLKVKNDPLSLKNSLELKKVRELFKKRENEFGTLGFFIIDKSNISIASKRDTNIGTKNLIAIHKPELLEKAFKGESIFIPPIETDVKIKYNQTDKANEHTMFFATPIKDKNGNVLAVMTQRLDVEGRFSDIINSGRWGESIESYIFGDDGSMLSESRFIDDLVEIGLLNKGEKAHEQIKIKDPGANLIDGYTSTLPIEQQPLTKMAQHAISLADKSIKESSQIYSDIKGYRDYRGVEVLGVWTWYKRYGIGLTTEIDKAEALIDYYRLRQNLLIITSLTLLLTVMATVMLIILGEKATRSIQSANDQLNKLLESFDENVIASKTDLKGNIIYASKEFARISGYEINELIGKPQNIVRHPDMPKETFKALWKTIKSGKSWKGEVKNKKSDGSFYWVEAVISPEFDEKGNITGYSAIRQDITAKKEVEELSETLEHKVEERTEEINNQKQYIDAIMNSQSNIVISTDGQKIRTANNSFFNFFNIKNIAAFLENFGDCICDTFDTESSQEYLKKMMGKETWIEYVYNRPNQIHKTKIIKDGIEHIFTITSDKFTIGGETLETAVLTDITEIEKIQKEIESIHKHTQSSIEYAALIQHSIVPENDLFRKYFDDFFAIWQPKDIVGGDIYLFEELRHDNECMLIVIDCTGHGVPGAFVTMLVKAIERQIAALIAIDPNKKVSPAWVLEYFNKTMKKLLRQENIESISNAGFDGGVLYYNKEENIIRFAGAEIALFYMEDDNIKTIKGDRHSIGYKKSDANYKFTNHEIEVKEGMQFYMTTDGYLDQNGGEKGFPFGKKRFKSIIEKNYKESFADQQEILLDTLQEYQKDEERNDDMTLIGIKIGTNGIKNTRTI